METILGLIMLGSWVWSTVIVVQKTKNVTTVEMFVLFFALITAILFFIGSIS